MDKRFKMNTIKPDNSSFQQFERVRRFSAKCPKCKNRYDFKVNRDQMGYTKEQIQYFKTMFVCKKCKPQ